MEKAFSPGASHRYPSRNQASMQTRASLTRWGERRPIEAFCYGR
jgi:hypothetical protein